MTRLELVIWRDERGLTQAGLALALGLSRWAVNSWETGKVPVPAWLDLALLGYDVKLGKEVS